MAAQTTAPSERFVTGPLVMRFYSLTSVANGDTLAVPLTRILGINIEPTTNVSAGATISGSTITFVTGGTIACNLTVIGREG
ncbi:MAG: hypothetical protein KGL39_34455 [Patescibacteria group bacterium]|nr:hypothetical protein [Patescibacteria group bacterium]